jgi:hypothetical protein
LAQDRPGSTHQVVDSHPGQIRPGDLPRSVPGEGTDSGTEEIVAQTDTEFSADALARLHAELDALEADPEMAAMLANLEGA